MATGQPNADGPRRRRTEATGERSAGRWRAALRWVALGVWSASALAFWLAARAHEGGGLDLLLALVDGVAAHPGAPLALVALYLARPFLLVPITVMNLASGFVLGVWPGVALALLGTLVSASVGYALGRLLHPDGVDAAATSRRWRLARALRRRGFESVAAGGLMYLHADAVNVPAGMLRVPYPVFLAGIAVGNALTMSAAVVAGASLVGPIVGARVSVDAGALALAALLFVTSVGLAAWLRRRAASPSGALSAGRSGRAP